MNSIKKAISLVLALVLILGCTCALAEGDEQVCTANTMKYEGEGFATPEEALTCYMEGLKNLDFDQMMSAFAP